MVNSSKRSFTSAIPGMSVADMRRCLSEVRSKLQLSLAFKQGNQFQPFDLKAVLSNGMELWKFVHLVAIGLHVKRAHNRKRAEHQIN